MLSIGQSIVHIGLRLFLSGLDIYYLEFNEIDGCSGGDFDVQKYKIDKRIVVDVNFFDLYTGIIKTYIYKLGNHK
jgi:hypothetical protein